MTEPTATSRCSGLLALLASVSLTLVYRTDSVAVAQSALPFLVPLALGAVVAPLALFAAYILEWGGGEGVVESVALRVARVETADGELVTIPNTILTSHEIVRPYGRGNHRVVHELGVSCDDDPAAALTHLESVAAETGGVLANPPPVAYIDELGEGVGLRVHYWIDDPNHRDVFEVRSAFARAAKERPESEGFAVTPTGEWEIRGHLDVDDARWKP